MRYISFLFIFLILTGCQEKEVSFLQERDGISYEANSTTPFTGKFVKRQNFNNENAPKKLEISYKDGRKHGLTTGWHRNSKRLAEESFKDGKRDGFLKIWYENGQQKFEGSHKEGERDGLATGWYENGQRR